MIVATDNFKVTKIDTAGNKIADFNPVNCLVEAISFSPDQKEVIIGGNDKVIRLFDLHGNLKLEYKGHRSGITSLSFSPDGKNIVSSSNDNTLRIWHIVRRNRDVILTSSKASFYFVESSPDSNYILSALGKLAVISSKKRPQKQYHLKGHNQDIYCAKYSPSGKYIGTASKDSTVRIWSNKGTHLKTLVHNGEVFSLDFSPAGDKIVTACSDGKAYVWDIAQGKAILALPEQSTQVNISLFTPDGKSILTVGSNSFATLWNMQGKIIRKFKGHDDLIFGADFSPDGKYLATSGYDKSIIIWEMDGTVHQRMVGHEGDVYSVCFSEDSKKLISASADNTVRLWGVNGNLIFTYTGHNSEVFNAKFDSDGNYVLSVSWDNEVRLWPVNSKELTRLVNETKIFRNVWRPKDDTFFNRYMK
jgi:WD40 repeat protein